MPPPQPLGLPLEESVKVVPSSNTVCLVPPPFVPVTYVAKAPISNSFPLKNETGGGGGGAITCFEDTIGSPAKVPTACEASVIMAKAIIFFIMSRCVVLDCLVWILDICHPIFDRVDE